LEETKENIGRVENGIVKLKKDPENEEELNSVLRALHTIKGSSRMLKFPGIEKTAHGMENLFKGIKEKRYGISNTFVQMVFIGCDLLKKGAEVIRKTGDDPEESPEYMSACEKVYAVEPFEIDEVRGSVGALLVESAPVPAPSGQDSEPKQETGFAAAGTSDYETIRVKLSGIESIMKTMNQIVIKQFQFKQIQESLGALDLRIHEELLDLRKIVSSRKEDETNGIYRNFQESHKELQAIKKSYVDQMAVIERNTYELQAQIMRLTMLPLELILGSLPRMVEEVSSLLGKDVECRISGMDILMDKSILENLNDPIIHIIRNSLDHGIEDPEERAARGKPRMGRIAISCISEGGNIVIRISDDGKGIDYERVKRQALERNLVSKEELDELTESDIYGFLFMPGFSTKSRVTDLSGRGVGLDIVRHNIQKVKGKITIKSVKGEGTEFILALPLSLATVGGFFIRSGGFKFLLPSNFVHKIVRLPKKEKLTYFNKDAFRLEDKIIPIYSLSSAMGITSRAKGDFLYVVVVESVGEFIGVIVDSVIQHANLIYKPLPKNMHKLKLLQGIVFDETYSIINILFIPELIRVFKNMKTMDLLRSKGADRKEVKTVLVVDDSLNTREIEKSILELEDYKVITAVDGIDGLAQLKEAKVDLIISDIDMPRMDGLTMIENIRKEGKYKNIPIVVISSYMEEDLRKKALSIGANAYIVKSEFDRNSLIGIAKKLA
jgi:chemotaxis protein histidine kinase CheA